MTEPSKYWDAAAYSGDSFDDDSEGSEIPEISESDSDADVNPVASKESSLHTYTRNRIDGRQFQTQELETYDSTSDDDEDVVISQTIAEINTKNMNLDEAPTPSDSGSSRKQSNAVKENLNGTHNSDDEENNDEEEKVKEDFNEEDYENIVKEYEETIEQYKDKDDDEFDEDEMEDFDDFREDCDEYEESEQQREVGGGGDGLDTAEGLAEKSVGKKNEEDTDQTALVKPSTVKGEFGAEMSEFMYENGVQPEVIEQWQQLYDMPSIEEIEDMLKMAMIENMREDFGDGYNKHDGLQPFDGPEEGYERNARHGQQQICEKKNEERQLTTTEVDSTCSTKERSKRNDRLERDERLQIIERSLKDNGTVSNERSGRNEKLKIDETMLRNERSMRGGRLSANERTQYYERPVRAQTSDRPVGRLERSERQQMGVMRTEHPIRKERLQITEKSMRNERSERKQGTERTIRNEKLERLQFSGNTLINGRSLQITERTTRKEMPERDERSQTSERTLRNEQSGRVEISERTIRNDGFDRAERTQRTIANERPGRSQVSANTEWNKEPMQSLRPGRSIRYNSSETFERYARPSARNRGYQHESGMDILTSETCFSEQNLPPSNRRNAGDGSQTDTAVETDAENKLRNYEPKIEFRVTSETPTSFNSDEYQFDVKLCKRPASGNLNKSKGPQRKSWSFTNDRVREIERQNQILLKKILTQKSTLPVKPKKKTKPPEPTPSRMTTAAVNRRKVQRQIDLDNQVLKRKIEAIHVRPPKMQ